MPKTIGTFKEFEKAIPKEEVESHSRVSKAVEKYLSTGGIIKVEGKGWPRLVYPSVKRLESQIKETERKLEDANRQINAWNKRHSHLETNKAADLAARVADPLYWEHHAKMVADPTYRKTVELVDPPMHLLHRKEWKKRLKLFVKNSEHRIRLREARTSVIGKKREGMTKEVEKRFEFSKNLAKVEKEKIVSKRDELQERVRAMRVLMDWAKTKP